MTKCNEPCTGARLVLVEGKSGESIYLTSASLSGQIWNSLLWGSRSLIEEETLGE